MPALHLDWMRIALVIFTVVGLVILWRAHRSKNNDFDFFDLFMENGRVSRIGVAFMFVLIVTTWIMIDLEMDGKMTEGYLTVYCTAWVVPLVAKVVFNKNDASTTSTLKIEETTTTKKET